MKGFETIKGYLFNLIIYTDEQRRSEYFHNLVHAFIEKYPCRVIFIRIDDTFKGDHLETSRVDSAAVGTPCDQLVITASPSQVDRVPVMILPRLVPDLPIYLVWGQNPTSENTILMQLKSLSSRLVYDSECAKDLQDFSKKMLSMIEKMKIDYMDVDWAEISGWRDVITQTFLSAEKFALLKRCKHLLIKFNKVDDQFIKHFATEAIYLQGWLAGQLGWEYQSIKYDDDTITIHYKNGEIDLEVVLQPQERPTLIQGKIFEVEWATVENLSVTLSLAEIQSKVMVYISTPEKCNLPFSLPFSDIQKGFNAMKEIFYFRTSDHYCNMLRVLSTIPWMKK